MNRQVSTNDTNRTRLVPTKPSILHHPPSGKRKAFSDLANVNKPNNNINKGFQKPHNGKAVHRFQPAVFQESTRTLQSHPSSRALAERPAMPFGFKIFCDEEQQKENSVPSINSISETTNKPSFFLHSPSKLESPGAQQEREEEEIIVLDSPMVVDSSLENLRLKDEPIQSREFMIPEYSQEIYTYLRGVESRIRPRVNYMRKQTDITSGMRRILVDWLVEVTQEYKLDQETLYLAISFIDRFLSCMAVLRAKLQLVGAACMFIASKYEEIYPPDVSEFVYITDDTYSKQQVLRMEHLVLKVLAFDLAVPTANFFLQRICMLCGVSTPTEFLARYLCELTLLEADPFLKFLPSETACAALALANYTMGKEMWSSELQLVTEFTEEDFRECLECLYAAYVEAGNCPQQAIREKYKSHKFHCVSTMIPPPALPPHP